MDENTTGVKRKFQSSASSRVDILLTKQKSVGVASEEARGQGQHRHAGGEPYRHPRRNGI